MDSHENAINADFSKRITALRFILTCFVVLIHSGAAALTCGDNSVTITIPVWADMIHTLVVGATGGGGGAVPTFFLIAGYLLFAKPKTPAKIIKSKIRSIVIPYLSWTVLTIFAYFLAQSFPFSKNYFTQPQNIIRNWTAIDFLKSFFCYFNTPDKSPFLYQFWYLRNLTLLIALSPLIKKAAHTFPLLYLTALTTANMLCAADIIQDSLVLIQSLFFFSLGLYAVKHITTALKMLDSIKGRDFLLAYGIVAFLDIFLSFQHIKGAALLSIGIRCFTICSAFKLAGWLSQREKIYTRLAVLSRYSFWIYAGHAPFVIAAAAKLSIRVFPLQGSFFLIRFFGIAFLCIGMLLFIGMLTKKALPKTFGLLIGGRDK